MQANSSLTIKPPTNLVGILGGLGPAASLDLCSQIISCSTAAGATHDSDHVPYIMLNNPVIPNSRLAAIGEGPSPLQSIVDSFRRLQSAGATEVCVACNTAHAFARQAAQEVGIPFIDMIKLAAEDAVKRVQDLDYPSRVVGLLGTDATLKMGLYQTALADAARQIIGSADAIRVVVPDDSATARLQECILSIKAGRRAAEIGATIEEVASALNAAAIVTGCTELPVCFSCATHPNFEVPLVSPTKTLANEIVRRYYDSLEPNATGSNAAEAVDAAGAVDAAEANSTSAALGNSFSVLRHLSADLLDEVVFHLHGFQASATFKGRREGRVFKFDLLGLGYYVDNRAPCAREVLRLTSTCKELRASLLPRLLPMAKARCDALRKEVNAMDKYVQGLTLSASLPARPGQHGNMLSMARVCQQRLEDAESFVLVCEKYS